MLKEISCSLFRKRTIEFKAGLNVVIGDDNASNSIGKSTLLMIIDFVFGGNTFLETNKDVINELGHHEYLYKFEFEGDCFHFKRKTETSGLVFTCDENYQEIESLSLSDYYKKLSDMYKLSVLPLSFRAIVGLYSRVWPKENLEVKKPLHIIPSQNSSECIDNLIKLFNMYSDIEELSKSLKEINAEKSALNSAFNRQIINKITKTQFKHNSQLIIDSETEISKIRANLSTYALDLRSLVNEDVLEAKLQKDKLLDIKLNLESKLQRVLNNLERNKLVTSKTFGDLESYFSEVNVEKLVKIESFHSSLASILRDELKATYTSLQSEIDIVDSELTRLENIISTSLKSIDNPNYIVDKVFEISNSLTKAKTENNYYESKNSLQTNASRVAQQLNEKKLLIIDRVMEIINKKLELLTTKVYGSKGKSPTLLLSEKSYEFTIFEDTGTGKAYSNLILFDLAILSITAIPYLIHDSILYKNVENNAVANLIDIYASFNKQTFIAMDEIVKYGTNAKKILKQNEVIQLTSESVLFIRNWKVSS